MHESLDQRLRQQAGGVLECGRLDVFNGSVHRAQRGCCIWLALQRALEGQGAANGAVKGG
jgi:hypothetical protein